MNLKVISTTKCEAAKEEEVDVTTTTTTKKRGKRKPLPKTLPREVIELDLDDHEKQCAYCKHSLHKIGEDRSEKLEFSPAVLKVLEYVRPKYACRQCEQTKDKSHIVQKPAPQSIIPKSFATESLLANIILANTNMRCHFTAKSRCLPSRVSSCHEPLWQGGLSKSVRSSHRFTQP
uniref:Mobile element protein n=2 Tax=Vibrio TaxID=662 RepID=A0A0H3ZZH9_9VIBR|nr:Mobile element protein [Vibrio sp. FF_286]AKN40037.1 Mobile element protein [Vibrio tasmaniensis]